MVTAEVIRAAITELILPQLNQLQQDVTEVKTGLNLTNKRLDDVNAHLADQSRRIDETNNRIDAVRTELGQRIDAVRTDLGQRIDAVRTDLGQRIDETNNRIGETNDRIDAVRTDLIHRIDETHARIEKIGGRIDWTSQRIDRLAEVIVRREEFSETVMKIMTIEREINDIKRTIAA